MKKKKTIFTLRESQSIKEYAQVNAESLSDSFPENYRVLQTSQKSFNSTLWGRAKMEDKKTKRRGLQ